MIEEPVRALVLSPVDAVGVLLSAATPQEEVDVGEPEPLIALDPIPAGHKIALRALPAGSVVTKYGEPIGVTTVDIRAGEHVHAHNLRSARAENSAIQAEVA
jgi:altronate dehydratase